MKKNPLVSVIIPNYNHSVYLDTCIGSILSQTYGNIEIIVLDNSSEDNSISILKKYSGRNVRICRNVFNIFSKSYLILSEILAEGDYLMMLPADDYIEKTFIEKAVKIMETYPNVGYVHGEKDFVTEDNKLIVTDPFYNCSFIADGENVMPIYMMTTVAHPAQGVIRKTIFDRIKGYRASYIDYSNADKTLWFYLSTISDYGYIRDKMAVIRVGGNTDTSLTKSNMQYPMLTYLTIRDFAYFANRENYVEASNRGGKALNKLAKEYMDIVAAMIRIGDFSTAKKYLIFSKIISREIENDKTYIDLYKMWESKTADLEYISNMSSREYSHIRSYEPPEGYRRIEI